MNIKELIESKMEQMLPVNGSKRYHVYKKLEKTIAKIIAEKCIEDLEKSNIVKLGESDHHSITKTLTWTDGVLDEGNVYNLFVGTNGYLKSDNDKSRSVSIILTLGSVNVFYTSVSFNVTTSKIRDISTNYHDKFTLKSIVVDDWDISSSGEKIEDFYPLLYKECLNFSVNKHQELIDEVEKEKKRKRENFEKEMYVVSSGTTLGYMSSHANDSYNNAVKNLEEFEKSLGIHLKTNATKVIVEHLTSINHTIHNHDTLDKLFMVYQYEMGALLPRTNYQKNYDEFVDWLEHTVSIKNTKIDYIFRKRDMEYDYHRYEDIALEESIVIWNNIIKALKGE